MNPTTVKKEWTTPSVVSCSLIVAGLALATFLCLQAWMRNNSHEEVAKAAEPPPAVADTEEAPRYFYGPLAAAWAVVSIAIASLGTMNAKWLHWIVIGTWAMCPPIYFIWEYGTAPASTNLEHLKHYQDLASHLWAAFAVLLGTIYSARGFKVVGGH